VPPPPHWAAQKVVSVLVDSGADIHAANGAGISPLTMADTREAGLLRVCDRAIRGGEGAGGVGPECRVRVRVTVRGYGYDKG